MKRLIFLRNALLFCAPAIMLGGCAAVSDPAGFTPKNDESYAMDAAMEYGDGQTANLHLTRIGSDVWEASFTEPPTLSGVILAFDSGNVTASYKGLEFTVPKSALPAKNMLAVVTDALDQAAAAEQLICTEQEDGTWCYTAESAGGSFTLTFSESGEPIGFSLPSQPLTVTFSAYTVSAPSAETAPPAADTAPAVTAVTTQNEGTSE